MRTNTFNGMAAALAVAGAITFGGAREARAQQANAWYGYAPSGATVVAPAAPVAPPNVVYYTPGTPAAGTAWQGYAPAVAWDQYRPQTSWQYYQPQRGWTTSSGTQANLHPSRNPTGPRNREFGTGRNTVAHKPWLPSHP